MTVSVVLFTSDLRLHDHPPLRAALDAAEETVPLFVLDPGVEAADSARPTGGRSSPTASRISTPRCATGAVGSSSAPVTRRTWCAR